MLRNVMGLVLLLGLALGLFGLGCQRQAPSLADLGWATGQSRPTGQVSGSATTGTGAAGAAADAGAANAITAGDAGNPAIDHAPGSPNPASAANAAYGYLEISIRWPRQGADFKPQLIPQSTNRLDLVFKDSLLNQVASMSIERLSADQTVATASIKLPAGPVDVEASAFRVVASASTEVAKATTRITVVGNARVPAVLTLVPLIVPTITAVSPAAARAGETVTIEGTNFGEIPNPFGGLRIPTVTFNGATASQVVPISATAIEVKVPDAATVGPVQVVIDGVPSATASVLWVIKTVSIAAARAAWDPSGDNSRLVFATKTLQFTATPVFAFAPGVNQTQFGTAPAAVWSSSNLAAGTVDANTGLYSSKDNSQTSQITAKLGTTESNAISVTGVVVLHVDLTPQTYTLGLPTPEGYDSADFPISVQFTGQASFSSPVSLGGVTWKSSDSGKATVNSEGLVTSVAVGSAVITATSVDDPRISATASIQVENVGIIDVIID